MLARAIGNCGRREQKERDDGISVAAKGDAANGVRPVPAAMGTLYPSCTRVVPTFLGTLSTGHAFIGSHVVPEKNYV